MPSSDCFCFLGILYAIIVLEVRQTLSLSVWHCRLFRFPFICLVGKCFCWLTSHQLLEQSEETINSAVSKEITNSDSFDFREAHLKFTTSNILNDKITFWIQSLTPACIVHWNFFCLYSYLFLFAGIWPLTQSCTKF